MIASGIFVALSAGAFLLIETADALLLVFAALLLAIPIAAGADRLAAAANLNRHIALAAVILAIVAGFGAFGAMVAPTVAEQAGVLKEDLPQAAREVEDRLRDYGWGERLLERAQKSESFSSAGFAARAGGLFSTTLGFLGAVVLVLFLAVLFAATPTYYTDPLLRLLPLAKRARMQAVFSMAAAELKMWLIGKFAAMVLVGVLTTIGLTLLDVPLAAALGLIAAILTFVPNIGPVLAAVPAVLLAFVEGPMSALNVVLLYVGVQTVESYIVTPVIQQKTVSVPPGFTIVVQVILGSLAGLLGLFVATPLAVAARVFIRELYMRDALGEGDTGADASTAAASPPNQTR